MRLVPLFQLASCFLDYLLSGYCVSAWRMALAAVPRCGTHHDIVAIIFFAYRELEQTPCRVRVRLGRSVRACRSEVEQNCAFDGVHGR